MPISYEQDEHPDDSVFARTPHSHDPGGWFLNLLPTLIALVLAIAGVLIYGGGLENRVSQHDKELERIGREQGELARVTDELREEVVRLRIAIAAMR